MNTVENAMEQFAQIYPGAGLAAWPSAKPKKIFHVYHSMHYFDKEVRNFVIETAQQMMSGISFN